jgi:serine protease inhibitor ecotin
VICPKNTYSTGGTKKCTDCKAANSEYADAEGSTSCKICEGKVENGDCQALVVYCKVEKITLKGVGDEEFTFKKISSGNTDSVPCKKNDDKEKEKNAGTITRK